MYLKIFFTSSLFFLLNLSFSQVSIIVKSNKTSDKIILYNKSLFSNDAPVDIKDMNYEYLFKNSISNVLVLKSADKNQFPYLFTKNENYIVNKNKQSTVNFNSSNLKVQCEVNVIANTLASLKFNPFSIQKNEITINSNLIDYLKKYDNQIDSFRAIYNYEKSKCKTSDFSNTDNYVNSSIDFVTLQYIYIFIVEKNKPYNDEHIKKILYVIQKKIDGLVNCCFMETVLSAHLLAKINLFLLKKNITLSNEFDVISNYFSNKNIIYSLKYLLINSMQQKEQDNAKKYIETLSFNDIPKNLLSLFENKLVINNSKTSEFINYLNQKYSNDFYKIKNKLVLLDVWASWCKPCIEEFNYSKKNIAYYDTSKFLILTISLDKDINSWKKAVSIYKLNEANSYLTINNFNSEFAKQLTITAIPRYILIGKDGKVISADAPRPSDPKLKILIDKYINQ